jgi:hypothetical protein
MTSDDDWVAELAGDGGISLDPGEQAELTEQRALLADPAVWAEPDPALEDRVVAAIAAEAAAQETTARAPAPTAARRSRRPWLVAVAGVAAAVIIALVAVVSLRSTGSSRQHFDVALPAGSVTFTKFDSGWRVDLDVSDLPRLDGGRFYQAWMRNAAGTLVPVGSFNEGRDVTLWAGVSPLDYPTFTVTREQADGNQASSGDRVLVAQIPVSGP